MKMSEQVSAIIDNLDPAVSSKVREIIEEQWGKSLEDLKDLNVGQLHERLIKDDLILYRPTNRYVLRVQFRYAPEPRRIIFNIV